MLNFSISSIPETIKVEDIEWKEKIESLLSIHKKKSVLAFVISPDFKKMTYESFETINEAKSWTSTALKISTFKDSVYKGLILKNI